MAKRRRLEAPGAEDLADLEAGFAAKPVPDRMGLNAPISQIAAEAAALSQPLTTDARIAMARDASDAGAWREALGAGRVLVEIPLDQIEMEHLVRDRMVVEASELEELKSSIRANGMRLPIEVISLPGGSYGLVSGWRRLTVVSALRKEGDEAFATIRAIIRPPSEVAAAYTAMVEENELRAQLSPYERGRIAVVASDQGAFGSPDAAVEAIFTVASKAKRSKIRSFALVHEELGDMLNFPTDLSERNGLRLAHALREGFATKLRSTMALARRSDPAQEWAILEPIVVEAEQGERPAARGGRPRVAAKPLYGAPEKLANGMTMERVAHEDGYSIRLRGRVVDAVLMEAVMAEVRRLLEPI